MATVNQKLYFAAKENQKPDQMHQVGVPTVGGQNHVNHRLVVYLELNHLSNPLIPK